MLLFTLLLTLEFGASSKADTVDRTLSNFLLGDSGEVVNSLDLCPASLKSLGYFYFRCVLSSQCIMVGGDSEFTNFTLPALKAFLESRNHVSGNKQ